MYRALSLALLALSLPLAAAGETATLLGDFNSTNDENQERVNSNPKEFVVLGNRMVFVAEEPSSASELWVTDGTPAGTRILEDICPGACSSIFKSLGVVGGVSLWFVVPGEQGPGQLWRSDGTEPGTYLLDLPFGFSAPDYAPPLLLGGALYFGHCSAERDCELWRCDGTAAGTRAVKSIATSSSSFGSLVAAGNQFYFTLGSGPVTLWASDGTAAGTRLVREFPSGYGPFLMTGSANGRLFFALYDDQADSELWVSDGTAAGTRSLTHFEASNPFDGTDWIKPIGNRVYLLLNDVLHGQEIWRSDGTEQGTRRVTEFGVYEPFNRDLGIEEIEEIGGRVVFRATDGLSPDQVWVSNGAPESTAPLGGQHLCTYGFVRAGGRVFLEAREGVDECALWSTDGTTTGTRPVDICPVPYTCDLTLLDAYQSSVLFLHQDRENGKELWLSDGTAAGTRRLTDMPGSAQPAGDRGWDWAWSGDRLFFTGADGHGAELWIVENGETRLVADIARREPSSRPQDLAPFGDRLVFTACDGRNRQVRITSGTPETTSELPVVTPGDCVYSYPDDLGLDPVQVGSRVLYAYENQLWSTDGTNAGTIQLTHFTATNYLYYYGAAVFQGKVFFPVSVDGSTEIWKSDGTLPGTVKAFDPSVSEIYALTTVGNELYFTAYLDGNIDAWRSDGTQAGTRKLTNEIDALDPWFTRAGSSVFFVMKSDFLGSALWKTDGTPAGTVRVRELNAEGVGVPRELTEHQGKLYFFALDGSAWNLWRSDGTEAGTIPLRSFQIIDHGSAPPAFHLLSFEGRLYFAADGGGLGNELWTSDGTAAGTVILRDILPGAGPSRPSWLTVAAGRLFFAADDGEHGHELWTSDGTAAGTRLVHDLAPEDVSSFPESLTATPTHLYFTADDGVAGRELWSLPLAGGGCQPALRHLCLGSLRYRVEATWKDFQGNTGKGTAVMLTADTGYFWFFRPDNAEVMVKVLDGTGVNGHRWVFYGALSSVEYTITVTDTQTGLTRRYFNPPGQLASVGDTTGFGPLGAFARTPKIAEPAPAALAEERTVAAIGTCLPAAERLCLGDLRFAVEVAWKDFQGHQGTGKAFGLTPETGYFWFFDAANVELMIKVLDGTTLNGKHWVFYGALSSVEYTITVTDTETGMQRIYRNPSGQLASVADTEAF